MGSRCGPRCSSLDLHSAVISPERGEFLGVWSSEMVLRLVSGNWTRMGVLQVGLVFALAQAQ